MINLKTKAEGMIYRASDGREYTIHHGYFKVIDFAEVPNENKYEIHIQNRDIDARIVPYIDTKETLTKGCNIKVAYIVTDYGINCHGYEVTTIPIPELENLPQAKRMYLRETEIDIIKYKDILYKYVNAIQSEPIRQFVSNILEKNWKRFSIWPAATNVHHNYMSGLLQHSVNVVKNAYNIAFNYTDIDLDIVLASAILHDIGKIYEYDEDGSISGEGKLFDHINIGTRMLFEEYYHGKDSVYNFSERDIYSIAHVILSHHGKLEWGSPRTPATQEAMIVHYADYIDTNMFIAHKELQNLDIDQSVKSRYAGQLVQTKFTMSDTYDKN